jgi:hypothetical protein
MALSIGDVRIPPKADIAEHGRHVRFVPKAEVAVIRSVELIVQPDAHDVVGEMGVGSHGPGQRGKKLASAGGKTAAAKDVEVSSDPRSR